MSDDRKRWFRRVRDILSFIEKTDDILQGKTQDDFLADEVLYLAIERLIQNIGEASIHLPDEIKARAPDIPWQDIASMRHILVHGYDIADPSVTWDTATKDIHILKNFLSALTGDELS